MTFSIIPILQRFCTRRVFKDWAAAYERDVDAHDYSAARTVTEAALPLIKPGMAIADLGIGTGLVAKALKKHDPSLKISGLDISREMLDLCARSAVADLLALCDVGRERWPLENQSQAMIASAGLFEYLTKDMLDHVLQESLRVLKPGGFFIFAYIPGEKNKPSTALWDGRSGKIFSCAYPPHWLEEKVTMGGFDIAAHHERFPGSVFTDGSSYDYRLMVLIKRA